MLTKMITNGDLQQSRAFLIKMLTTFLDLTAPASRKANPHCMNMTKAPMISRKNFKSYKIDQNDFQSIRGGTYFWKLSWLRLLSWSAIFWISAALLLFNASIWSTRTWSAILSLVKAMVFIKLCFRRLSQFSINPVLCLKWPINGDR